MTMEYRTPYSPERAAAHAAIEAARQQKARAWGFASVRRDPAARKTKDQGRYVYYAPGPWVLIRADGTEARASAAQARALNALGS